MYEHNAFGYRSGLALCLTKVRSSRACCPATALINILCLFKQRRIKSRGFGPDQHHSRIITLRKHAHINLSNFPDKSQEHRGFNYNFDADITRAELILAIRSLKSNKAVGIDELDQLANLPSDTLRGLAPLP